MTTAKTIVQPVRIEFTNVEAVAAVADAAEQIADAAARSAAAWRALHNALEAAGAGGDRGGQTP